MAKRKRITKNSVNARNDEIGRIEQSGRNTCNYTPFLAIIIGLVVIIAILLTGFGQDSDSQSNSQPGQNIQNQPVLFSGNLPQLNLKPEFAGFFPDNITGMRRVKLLMDPLNEETGGQFASKVADKATVLYISDSVQTDFEIEYSVYKMQSPEAAAEVLNFYTTQMSWNTLPKKYDNFTFWLWQGYLEGKGRPQGMFVYWDNLDSGAFLPIDRSGTHFIAQSSSDLLCLHGEAAKGNYFIMVDVHAPSWQVSEVADKMFAEAAKQINA